MAIIYVAWPLAIRLPSSVLLLGCCGCSDMRTCVWRVSGNVSLLCTCLFVSVSVLVLYFPRVLSPPAPSDGPVDPGNIIIYVRAARCTPASSFCHYIALSFYPVLHTYIRITSRSPWLAHLTPRSDLCSCSSLNPRSLILAPPPHVSDTTPSLTGSLSNDSKFEPPVFLPRPSVFYPYKSPSPLLRPPCSTWTIYGPHHSVHLSAACYKIFYKPHRPRRIRCDRQWQLVVVGQLSLADAV